MGYPATRLNTNPTKQHFYYAVSLMFILMSACTPLSASDNQQKLDALRQSIQTVQAQLAAQEKIKQDAADDLLKTEHAIQALNSKLTALQQQLQTVKAELNRLTATYNHALNDLRSHQNQLNALLYQQYTRKPPNYFTHY